MFLSVSELASLGLDQGREMVWYWVHRHAMAIAGITRTHENWTTLQFSFAHMTEKDGNVILESWGSLFPSAAETTCCETGSWLHDLSSQFSCSASILSPQI